MSIRSTCALIGGAAYFALALGGQGLAETAAQECGAKYQAAKAAGALNGQTWQQFYSKCAAEAKAAAPTAAAPAPAAAAPPAAAPATVNPLKPRSKRAAPAAAAGEPVFPSAISPTYANEKPGRARQKTCVDQFKANKAANANGGLKWIQKSGGYYSECNKRLKGAG
jgi:hypothetical protein